MEAAEPRPWPAWAGNFPLLPFALVLAAVCLSAEPQLALPGAVHEHREATLTFFDLTVWLAAGLVLLARFRAGGWRSAGRCLGRAPAAAWLLAALTVWSALVWPRLAGGEPVGPAACGRKLLPVVEYGVLVFAVFCPPAWDGRARRWALSAMIAALAAVEFVGLVEYFSPGPDFGVGSLAGNRNALGALLAAATPFCAALALAAGGARRWRLCWGALAAGGALLAATAGAVLGIACGALAGAALLGRRRLALAAGALALVFALGQLLPRHNLSAALEGARPVRRCPRTDQPLLAVRWLRAGYELRVLEASLREPRYFFGLGAGGYGRQKSRFKPDLDDRPAGQTDNPENFDVLTDEPGTFNLFLVAGAEMGLLGVLGFLWLFAAFGARALASWRESGAAGDALGRALAAGAFAAVVGAAAASPFGSVWVRGAGPTLAVIVALAARPAPAPGPAGGTEPPPPPS